MLQCLLQFNISNVNLRFNDNSNTFPLFHYFSLPLLYFSILIINETIPAPYFEHFLF